MPTLLQFTITAFNLAIRRISRGIFYRLCTFFVFSTLPLHALSDYSWTYFMTTFAGGVPNSSITLQDMAVPVGIAFDGAGNLYVADRERHSIFKINPAGETSVFAGSGEAGSADGVGTEASFRFPTDVAVDSEGNVFVADWQNQKIRKITSSGVVSTLAGGGTYSDGNPIVDGIGTAANFHNPYTIAIDAEGTLYVGEETLVRKVSPTGVVTTLAGKRGIYGTIDTIDRFSHCSGIAVDKYGYVYVTDKIHRIRKISPNGSCSILAGNGAQGSNDGPANDATFNGLYGIDVDTSGNVFVMEYGNRKIRKITPQGLVSTIAGSGASGNDNGPGAVASFLRLQGGIALSSSGDIYISDGYNSGGGYIKRAIPPVQKNVSFDGKPDIRFIQFGSTKLEAPCHVNVLFRLAESNNRGVVLPPRLLDLDSTSVFNVREDGSVLSPAESFLQIKKIDEVPATIKTVLLIDNSFSLRDSLATIRESAKSLVDQILPNQEIAIYSFSENSKLLQNYTNDTYLLKRAIDNITLGSPTTNLYGTMYDLLGAPDSDHPARWAERFSLDGFETGYLVVLTDGKDESGLRTEAEVTGLRNDQRKQVFTIGLGSNVDYFALTRLGNAGYIHVNSASQLATGFSEVQKIIEEAGNSFYWLNYASPRRGNFNRNLTIEFAGNTNPNFDRLISTNFNSINFSSLTPAVLINPAVFQANGVSNLSLSFGTPISAKAKTRLPISVAAPQYTWSIGDPTLASLTVLPGTNGGQIAIQAKVVDGATTLTLTDIVNGYTRTIPLIIGTGLMLTPQMITFAAPADRVPTSPAFSLTATASSTLPVSFALVSGPATLSGNIVTLTGASGTVIIRATQAGNASYSAAVPIDRSFTVDASVITPPVIGTQPVSATINSGGTVTLSVAASGSSPAFQWYAGTTGVTTNPISGATGASFTTPSLTTATSYWVRASNAAGTADSNTATVSVITPPTITAQPSPTTTIHSGGTTTLTVAASGTSPTFQWYAGTTGVTTHPISGTTGTSFTTPALTTAASYWVRVSNAAGTADSNTTSVSVVTPPTITAQPAPASTIHSGGTTTLTVAASGSSPTYQWYVGISGVTTHPISGATGATFTTPALTTAASYWVRASNAADTADSNTATVSLLRFTLTTNGTHGSISGAGIYDGMIHATISATPDPDYVFSGWSGDASGTTNPLSLLMDSNKHVSAIFSPVTTDPFLASFVGTPFELRVGNQVTFDLNRLLTPGETIKLSGKLPSGLKYNAATGLITGTISGKPGTYQASVQILQGKTVVRTIAFPITALEFPSSLIGNFDCLMEDTNSVPVGVCKVTITSANRWSATLESAGATKRRSAKGTFILGEGIPVAPIIAVFPNIKATSSVAEVPAVTVNLSIDGSTPVISGTYDGGTLRGFRAAKVGETPPATVTYSLVLDAGDQDGIDIPAGLGWMKGKVSNKGIGSFKGLLGDGTSASFTLRASAYGQAILWSQPYKNKSSYIGGIVTLGNLGQTTPGEPPLTDEVWWTKAADAKTPSYPNGFSGMPVTLGTSRWTVPASATALGSALGWRDNRKAAVSINGAGLNNQESQPTTVALPTEFMIDDKFNFISSAPTTPPLALWKGKASKTDGSISGTLKLPSGFSIDIPGGTASVSGVLVQDESWETVTGTGLIKVPVSGAKGSFRTATFELGQ